MSELWQLPASALREKIAAKEVSPVELTKAVIQLLGEDILMYASDYPHGESWFPESATTVLGWNMPPERKRKLFWDNAVRFYARCGLA